MKQAGHKRVTINDIANRLNITPSTVSRALQNHPRISEATKKSVLAMAKKLNYQPNTFAAGLRKGKSNTIGVIVPHINRDFFANVIAGIENVAFEEGYNVVICQTHDSLKKEQQHVQNLLNSRVDGILASLCLESVEYTHYQKIVDQNIPLIFFDRVCEQIDVSKIIVDDYSAAYKSVKHLIEQGYTRIAHFGGPEHINIYHNRKKGYLQALYDNNLQIDEQLIITNKLTIEAGRQGAEKLFSLNNPPDALFAASDYSALGAMFYFKDKGIKVPQQVGVCGVSNESFTSFIYPSLTTIEQHSIEMGNFSARLFIEEIKMKGEHFVPRKTILEPELIIRQSTQKNMK